MRVSCGPARFPARATDSPPSTHYVDSTGETPFVRRMRERYDAKAGETGALIVPMCGFDSVPSDLGVLAAVLKLRERGFDSVEEAASYVTLVGGVSGGTLQTGIVMESDPALQAVVEDPFALGGGPVDAAHLAASKVVREARFDEAVRQWTAPFLMEQLNTRVVRASAAELAYRRPGSGGFVYREFAATGSSGREAAERLARPGPPAHKREAMIKAGQLPKPGDGPAPDARARAWFQVLVRARAAGIAAGPRDAGDAEVWISVTGGDAGYEDTAAMVCEAALTLALQRDALPRGRRGGVVTPAVGLGSALIERLTAAGILFQVVPGPAAVRGRL